MSDLDDVVRWYESVETPWPYRGQAEPEPQLPFPCPDTIPCSAPDSDEGGLES